MGWWGGGFRSSASEPPTGAGAGRTERDSELERLRLRRESHCSGSTPSAETEARGQIYDRMNVGFLVRTWTGQFAPIRSGPAVHAHGLGSARKMSWDSVIRDSLPFLSLPHSLLLASSCLPAFILDSMANDNVGPGLINPSHYWGGVPSKMSESPLKGIGHPHLSNPTQGFCLIRG